MGVLDDFVKTSLNKSEVDSIKDVVGSMHLIDFGVITSQYEDGTCDVTCIKKVKSGGLLQYHGIEILYPCGIKNAQVNQLCILVNPFSSVYRTYDLKNPDFVCDHDVRCIKAIPVSNAITDIFAGIDAAGNFRVSNKFTMIGLDKWSSYFGTSDERAGVTVLQDGTIDISANGGLMHILIHSIDGLAFVHYGSDGKALEALVIKPNGEKYSLYFCSEVFTFVEIKDILDIGKDKWKRVEYTDTDGVFTIAPGNKWSGDDRHLATSEDLKLLWDAFKNHTHTVSVEGVMSGSSSASGTAAIPITTLTTPKKVAGIIVKDGDDA